MESSIKKMENLLAQFNRPQRALPTGLFYTHQINIGMTFSEWTRILVLARRGLSQDSTPPLSVSLSTLEKVEDKLLDGLDEIAES
jgi:hypothetical protein